MYTCLFAFGDWYISISNLNLFRKMFQNIILINMDSKIFFNIFNYDVQNTVRIRKKPSIFVLIKSASLLIISSEVGIISF